MKYLYVILITVAACLPVAYKIHSWRVDSLKLEWQATADKKLAAQKDALTATCNAEKALTQEVSNVYQNRIAGLDRQLSAARGLLNRSCIAVKGSAAIRYDAPASAGKPARQSIASAPVAGQDGTIEAGSFLDLMGEGERYRLQLLSCQDFIKKTAPAMR